MARMLTYGTAKQKAACRMATIKHYDDTYRCECYEGIYFDFDKLPKGKRQYYCRHSDDDCCEPVTVRKKLGFMVNFWGCIVVDQEIDFHEEDEISMEFNFDD